MKTLRKVLVTGLMVGACALAVPVAATAAPAAPVSVQTADGWSDVGAYDTKAQCEAAGRDYVHYDHALGWSCRQIWYDPAHQYTAWVLSILR